MNDNAERRTQNAERRTKGMEFFIKNILRSSLLLLCSSFLVLRSSLLLAAPPPAATTPEALLWDKVNMAYMAGPTSRQTVDLLQRFVDSYPDSKNLSRARYLRAQISFQQKNYREALAKFEYLLTNHPKVEYADSALFRLAECYYNLKAWKSAAQKWEELSRKYKGSHLYPEAIYALALMNAKDGKWGVADDMLEKLTEGYPAFADLPHVRELYGIVMYHLGDFAKAAKYLEGLKTSIAIYYRGLSLFTLKLYDDAIASLSITAAEEGGPFVETSKYLKGEGFFQKRNYSLSLPEFEGFLKRFPTSSLRSYSMIRVGVSQAQTGYHHEALKTAQAMGGSAQVPYQAKVYGQFLEGSMLLKLGDFPRALAIFNKLIANKEYADVAAASLIQKAWAHRKMEQKKECDSALRLFEQKYSSSPNMALALYLMGVLAYESEDYLQAASRFETAVIHHQYTPISEMALAMMTICYNRAKSYDRLTTSANATLKLIEKNYASISPYWRAQSYYFIGDAYMQLKQPGAALPYFQRVVQDYSENPLAPRAQLALAWCHLDLNHFDLARKEATPLLNIKTISKDYKTSAQFLIGSTYFNSKDYNRAIKHYAEFAKANPTHELTPYAIYGVGLAYYQQKVYGSAIDEWKKLVKAYPNHETAQDSVLHVGDLYMRGGKHLDAAGVFKSFLERWPTSPMAHQAHLLLAQSYYNAKDDDRAIAAYQGFIKAYPKDPDLKSVEDQIELCYYRRGDLGGPEKLQEFINRYPKSPYAPDARFKLANLAMGQSAWGRAAREWELLIRDYPNYSHVPEAYYQLGQAYEKLKDPEQALIQYRALLKEYASKPYALDGAFSMGTIQFKKGNYKEAAEAFEFVLKRNAAKDVKANACYNLAVSYENLGKMQDSAKYYLEFANITPDKEKAWDSKLNAGNIYRKVEDYSKAIDIYSKLFKTTKDKVVKLQLVNWMAECYKDNKDASKAINVYQKLVGMEPVNHDLRLVGLAQLAFLYEQKKDWEGAIKVYEKIVISGGRADWVKSAKDRIQILNRQLEATEPAKR